MTSALPGCGWPPTEGRSGRRGRSTPSAGCAPRTGGTGPRRSGPSVTRVRLAGVGPHGGERRHYPDLVLTTETGHRVAIELELTGKGRRRTEEILGGYAFDHRSTLSSTSSPARGPATRSSERRPRPGSPTWCTFSGSAFGPGSGARASLAAQRIDREGRGPGRRRRSQPEPGAGPMTPAPRPRRNPYWTIPALLFVLSVPLAWSVGVCGVVIAVRAGVALARRGLARRALRRGAADGRDSVALGTDGQGRPVTLQERQLAAHGLIVGASGAGKSTTLLGILSEQIIRGRPVVAIDLKGSPAFVAPPAGGRRGRGAPRADLDPGRSRSLEPARGRQRHRAQGQADRHRAVLRAPLPAGG